MKKGPKFYGSIELPRRGNTWMTTRVICHTKPPITSGLICWRAAGQYLWKVAPLVASLRVNQCGRVNTEWMWSKFGRKINTINQQNGEVFHFLVDNFDGLVQQRHHSSAFAMELRLSCAHPSIYKRELRNITVKIFSDIHKSSLIYSGIVSIKWFITRFPCSGRVEK